MQAGIRVGVLTLPETGWVDRSCTVSWSPHAQVPDPVCAGHGDRFSLLLDPGAGATLYWPLIMEFYTVLSRDTSNNDAVTLQGQCKGEARRVYVYSTFHTHSGSSK